MDQSLDRYDEPEKGRSPIAPAQAAIVHAILVAGILTVHFCVVQLW